ncbi:hypothetical protein EJ02DRAFT_461500 [Clathrospora elynae]|uniref:RING-type domain-containing protein n=1 Tax=Clathrospora elynae TaxID=706981 RepID=A0A6A5TB42_9PLEO|nr:hypothetical protein EJ02DRAFT_461500 [Clathrospora elynae]
MLLAGLQRLPWQLICLLFASVATATITPSNTSTIGPEPQFQGTLPLKSADGAQISQLIPLTRQAALSIEGNLYNTNFSNTVNISAGEIAYISCNPDDYLGLVDAQRVFEDAYNKANISGVILYSTATDYCDFKPGSNQEILQSFAVLSMTKRQDSATLRDNIDNLPVAMKYFVKVEGRGNDNNNNANNFSQQSPLGPSPSTAVAMIILYSITGIITALFLVIIITGAVRAHRHPERYGPRNVLGRPRQSRARGLGRAILETIPIVKFGEKETDKPADVELGSAPEARDVDGASKDNEGQTDQAAAATQSVDATSKTAAGVAETSQSTTSALAEDHPSGIAPAQPLVGGVAADTHNSSNDENLGCSICTEDFEKGQDLRVLPCNHKFHPECVDPWLLNVSSTCPLCRVDLRPVTSNDSNTSQNPDELASPLNPEAETSYRRRTIFRDILSLRQRPDASAEERISALRRLREQRRNASDGSVNAGAEDGERRSRRMSSRLSAVLTGRGRRDRERREESPAQQGEESTSVAQPLPQSPREGSPALDAGPRS